MSRLTRGPPFSGAAVAFIGRRMATLLLLAFEVAPLRKDACNPPVQSREPCEPLQMGQKGGEVNCSVGFEGFAVQETSDLRRAAAAFHLDERVDSDRRAPSSFKQRSLQVRFAIET